VGRRGGEIPSPFDCPTRRPYHRAASVPFNPYNEAAMHGLAMIVYVMAAVLGTVGACQRRLDPPRPKDPIVPTSSAAGLTA